MRFHLLLAGLLFMLIGPAIASSKNQEQMVPPVPFNELPEFRISPGEILYKRYCLFCHGEFGAGDGLNAYNLPTKPASFVTEDFRAKPFKQVQNTVRGGGIASDQGQIMPSFKNTFSSTQVNAIIDYIQNFEEVHAEVDSDDSDEL
jgi:mono/diheme cytochrome c family protein